MSTDAPQTDATGLPPLLSKLSEAQRTLLLDLQSLSVRKLSELLARHGLTAPNPTVISKRFVEATLTLADHVNQRSLEPVDLAAVVVDGTEYEGETVYWALGVNVDGQKLPLGFVVGPTESGELVKRLFDNLHGRGLDTRQAIWIMDGGKGTEKALNDLPWTAVRQRCTVHKSRRVVQRHLVPEKLRAEAELAAGHELDDKALKRTAEKVVYDRIRPAWEEDDPERAMQQLGEIAEWLRGNDLESAAKSLLADAEMSLTLQRLGIDDRKLRRALRTTNAIESTHSVLEDYRAKPDNWKDSGKRMRDRFFVAGLACAEPAWGRVATRPSLERLQLAVLAAAHPEVGLTTAGRPGTLVVEKLEPIQKGGELSDEKAAAALTDLLRWADRKDRRVQVGPEAFAGLDQAAASELSRWCGEHDFAAKTNREGARVMTRPEGSFLSRQAERRRAAQADRDAAAVRRRESAVEARDGNLVASAELLDGISELAQEMAPAMIDRDDLEALAAGAEATQVELATVAPELAELASGERLAIARDLALRRAESASKGAAPEPPATGLRVALGAAESQSLAAEAAFQAEQIARRPAGKSLSDRRRELGTPLARLDGVVAKVEAAALAKAAGHELRRRELLAGAGPGSPPRQGPRPPTIAALNRYRGLLGEGRAAAFEASARTQERKLRQLSSEELGRLRARLAVPWHSLDSGKARRMAILERDSGTRLRELERTRAEVVEWTFKAEEMKRGPIQAAARERVEQLQREARLASADLEEMGSEIAELRESDGNVDRFLDAHPEAALDYAAEVQFVRQRRLEEQARAAEAAELEQPAATVPAQEIAGLE